MLHSCGAILYTIYKQRVYVVLGREFDEWMPFKGTNEEGETWDETAVREIEEETCGLVRIAPNQIQLRCIFATNRKYYHIGLIYVDYHNIMRFKQVRKRMHKKAYREKTAIRLFDIAYLHNVRFHPITTRCIIFYLLDLKRIQEQLTQSCKKNAAMMRIPHNVSMLVNTK